MATITNNRDRFYGNVYGETSSFFSREITHHGATVQRNQALTAVDVIASQSRVIIIEGISGSGKDTLQAYLKTTLKDRAVHDYSEGDLLHSWKQIPIDGILELRVRFMKLFVDYMSHVLDRDKEAVFLLNRFHLSTYVNTIMQHPTLAREYDYVIEKLTMLPVHTFVLLLDVNEIEQRSLHPDRAEAWARFKQEIVANGQESFHVRLAKQQALMLEAATKQPIPYTLANLELFYDAKIGARRAQLSHVSTTLKNELQTRPVSPGNKQRKRQIPSTV